MKLIIALMVLIRQIFFVHAISLSNRLVGSPTVSCGPDNLIIRAETEDIFEGQVYVKSQRRTSTECYALYDFSKNSTTPEFSLPLSRISSCGLEMRRAQGNGSSSVHLSTVIIFSFHPSFVTAADRAFAVHCLFQQKEYQLQAKFDFIQDIPSIPVENSADRPIVDLTVVPGTVAKEDESSIDGIQIGQPLMLVWSIEKKHILKRPDLTVENDLPFTYADRTSVVYGIRVLGCSADSHDGKSMQIMQNGCSLDRGLVGDVRYSEDGQRAFSEGTAFKFPDQQRVYFKCYVKLCIKRFDHLILTGKSEEDLCERSPKCDAAERRTKRSIDSNDVNTIVVYGRMLVQEPYSRQQQALAQRASYSSPTVCLHPYAIFAGSTVSLSVYTITSATLIIILYNKCKSKKTPIL